MLKLSIPVNWQNDYFEKINFQNVEEVYGKLERDFFGGGRSWISLPHISKRRIKEFIEEFHKRNIKFNYLLNATCLDNREVTRKGYFTIRRFLDWLVSINVDIVTISLPFILQIIKKYYPNLKVNVSTQVRVDCFQRLKYWEELGADIITLSYVDLNRNFRELKRIVEKAKCQVQLIANLICRKNCPFLELHGNFSSHASQLYHSSQGFSLDYYCFFCMMRIFSNPQEIIKSCWIRPEDLYFYEGMGIKKIKLVERGMTTEALAKIVDAYTQRNYQGNFIDLVPSLSKWIYIARNDYFKISKVLFHLEKINIFKLKGVYKLLKLIKENKEYYQNWGFYINNKKLDGIVEYFFNNDCSERSCDECGYCKRMAEKIIIFQGEREENLKILNQLDILWERLIRGDFFRYGK